MPTDVVSLTEELVREDTAPGRSTAALAGRIAQRLRALLRNVKREAEAKKPPRSFRELFQELREIIRTQDR